MASSSGVTEGDITKAAIAVRILAAVGYLGSFGISPTLGAIVTLVVIAAEVWLRYRGSRTVIEWFLNKTDSKITGRS
jgi:hypothetical protein